MERPNLVTFVILILTTITVDVLGLNCTIHKVDVHNIQANSATISWDTTPDCDKVNMTHLLRLSC